ncbi:MAG: hypothetical protein HY790_12800 [Deltaproteobacteria bacterium]|nr:hypothetical protein [Deltaproteobacteria bacterium]MBI4796692.1 hypothetical protein [Deltaproteobacteria bacterium]
MNKSGALYFVAIGLLSLMLAVSSSWAQSGRRLHYSTLFNPATVDTVSGEVVRVEQVLSGSGADYCVHALLKTPRGQMTAILAPRGYMTAQGLTITPKDRVTVTGSLISVLGKPYILAMKVEGDRTMKLREANGRPAWAVGADWHVRSTSRKITSDVTPIAPKK